MMRTTAALAPWLALLCCAAAAAAPVLVPAFAKHQGFAPLSHTDDSILLDADRRHLTLAFAGPQTHPLHVVVSCSSRQPVKDGSEPACGPGDLPRHAVVNSSTGSSRGQSVLLNFFEHAGSYSVQVYIPDQADPASSLAHAARYSVTAPPPPPPEPITAGQVLGAAAAALGLGGQPVAAQGFIRLQPAKAAELRTASTAEARYAAVDLHSAEAGDGSGDGEGGDGGGGAGVPELAGRLCVWGDDEHNYRAIYGWVAAHIELDTAFALCFHCLLG